jgi:hypothetical protein
MSILITSHISAVAVVSQCYPSTYTSVKIVCSRGLATESHVRINSVYNRVLEATVQVIVNA